MSNSFNAEAAGMAAGLTSSIDDPVVPAEFAAHAESYLRAFYSVRVSMGTGCRFSKDIAPTAPQKPRKRKAAVVANAEPEAKVEPPAPIRRPRRMSRRATMNRITLIALVGLSIATSACATQPQPMTTAENTASLQCQYNIADNDRNYDELFLMSGRPVFDERGNPQGLSGRGFVAYHQCMSGKGYEIADAKPE